MNRIPEFKKLQFPEKRHKRNCKCTPKCQEYFKIDGFDVYCKKGLEQLAISMLNQVNGTNIAHGNLNKREWTTEQEKALINFIKKNGVDFGTYRIIGEMIGKPRESVKRKVYALEKEGRLKRVKKQ